MAGGEVFAITSEPHSLAVEAEEDWEIGFPAIGDPHHEIRAALSEKGWVDVFYNENAGHLRNRKWASHPKGYYQPAVIAIARDEQVLYRWRCVPSHKNMSGAGARPEAVYTWSHMKAALETQVDADFDREPVLATKDVSWFRFIMIMTAHGWFLRPKAFPLGRPDDPPSGRPINAMRRVYGFVALWILALVLLPVTWVASAFALWLVALTPGLIEIHRQFQNEGDAY